MIDDSPSSDKTETIAEDADTRQSRANLRAVFAASSEMLFVLLPFFTIAIVLAHRGQLRHLFFLPEWSIGSAVMVGQSIVRVVAAVLGKDVYKEAFVLLLSALLVILLVPDLVVLSLGLMTDDLSTGLAVAQACLFVASGLVTWSITYAESRLRDGV